MKKFILPLCIGTLLIVWIVIALTKKTKEPTLTPNTYSNLATTEDQNIIKNTLKKHNIKEKDIENLFYYVNYFNEAVKNEGLTTSGFQYTKQQPDYLDYDYLTALEKKNIDFMGTNCRISSFTLFKDFIRIWNPVATGATQSTKFDQSAIKNFPKKIFTEEEQKKFYTFFNDIPTQATKDQKIHIKNIQDYQKKNKITFANPDWTSLVSVWIHDDLDSALFIGHVWVLLKTDKNYVFLEKLSFDTPYVATVFTDKQALYAYLNKKYAKYTSQETAKPFIMENGELVIVTDKK